MHVVTVALSPSRKLEPRLLRSPLSIDPGAVVSVVTRTQYPFQTAGHVVVAYE